MKLTLGIVLIFGLLVSCDKCDPSNSIEGEIIEGAVVKSVGVPNQPILITSAEQTSFNLEVRLEGSVSYQPVNFAQYSVLAMPTTASCSSGYERIVERDDANEKVTYTINITQCEDCEGQVTIGNWVLIPAVPSDYSAEFELND